MGWKRWSNICTIINELGGEKIDIIQWNKDSATFIKNSLSPAKIMNIELNKKENSAIVQVEEDQLSLAIGRDGQNVKLAAKLTGWKIDIEGAEDFTKKDKDQKIEDKETEDKKEDEKVKKEVKKKKAPAKKSSIKKSTKDEKKEVKEEK